MPSAHTGCCLAGVSQIDRVVEAVEETLKGNTVHLLAKKSLPKLDLPKVSKRLTVNYKSTRVPAVESRFTGKVHVSC